MCRFGDVFCESFGMYCVKVWGFIFGRFGNVLCVGLGMYCWLGLGMYCE